MSLILGIDPGLASTGYGLIEAGRGRYRHIDHGTIKTPSSDPHGKRLLVIYRAVEKITDQYKPRYAAIESLFFTKNVTSAFPVAESRGVILLCFELHGIPVTELPPQEIKRGLTGHGRSSKAQVQEMVKLLLGMKEVPKPDHAADALAAAICCANITAGDKRIGNL